jgi:hypothetical protein
MNTVNCGYLSPKETSGTDSATQTMMNWLRRQKDRSDSVEHLDAREGEENVPKVTITIEDAAPKLLIQFSCDDPGRSYEEIKAAPSSAEALGFAAVSMIQAIMADSTTCGVLTDDDGSERVIDAQNPL